MPSNLLVPITYQLADIFKITLQITDLYEMFNLCNVLSLACFNLLLNITIKLFPLRLYIIEIIVCAGMNVCVFGFTNSLFKINFFQV